MSEENGPGNVGFTESIKGRLAIGFMVLVILPIFFLGYMAYRSERSALEDRIEAHLTSIADLQKDRVSSWLRERTSEAVFVASDARVSRGLSVLKGLGPPSGSVSTPQFKEIYGLMASIMKNHNYAECLVLDGKGRVVVSTDRGQVGRSLAGEPWFKDGIKVRPGGRYIQDIYMDNRLGLLAMAFTAPVPDYQAPHRAGGLAVLIIGVDQNFYPIFAGWPGMGRTGDTLIVRREGDSIVYLNRLRFMEGAPLKLRLKVGQGAPTPSVLGSAGWEGVVTATDYRGVKVLAAYRYITEMKWGFIVKEDYKDVFAAADELKVRVMVVFGMTLLFLFVLIYLVSTRIAEPIVSLNELSKRIAGGDFSVSLPVKRRDEVGSLASSFNDMASSLVEYRRQVDEKNKELEKANLELSRLAESLEEKVHARTQELENLNRALLSMMEDLDERTNVLEKYQEDLKLSARELEESRNRIRENLEIVERANVELRRMDRMKDHFLGMMFHELRTPLSLITGYSSNLLSDPGVRLEPMVEEALEGIYKGAERLRTIVTEMLDVSQIDAKGLRLLFAPADMGRLVLDALDELGSFISERKQDVVVEDGSSVPQLRIDKSRIRQVLVNIIGNAIKFTPDGGRIEVSFNTRGPGSPLLKRHGLPEGEYLEIVVKDSGIGIDADELARIFEKFYEVGEIDKHATSKFGFLGRGVGLGLPIARGIVEAHGGRLWAESRGYDPDRCPGSSFHILLPVFDGKKVWDEEASPAGAAVTARAQAASARATGRQAVSPAGESLRRSVLVIDDDQDILSLTISTLEREYNVSGAPDGKSGVEKAVQLIPDLILLDIYMEGMNGYEVCAALKKDERTKHIPVAMFTAGAQRWEVERGYEAGADYYVTKPFKPAELLKKVGEFISGASEPARHKVD